VFDGQYTNAFADGHDLEGVVYLRWGLHP